MFSDSAFRTTSIIFILITMLVFLTKPKIFFGSKGNIKKFGFQWNDEETPFTLDIFIYGTMVLCYIILIYIDNLFFFK